MPQEYDDDDQWSIQNEEDLTSIGVDYAHICNIMLLCEVEKKAPLHTYKVSNIAKQQSFQENIKKQNCTYLGAEFTLPKLEPRMNLINVSAWFSGTNWMQMNENSRWLVWTETTI